MPFIKLQFRPGVNRDQTDYSNEGGWYECDKIRFRSGYPQKLGGWRKSSPTSFRGYCRQMMNWVTSYADNLLAMGTNEKAYLEAAGYLYDITPLRTANPTLITPDTDNSINTSSGLTTIVVNLATPHDAQTGSYVVISGVDDTPISVSFTNGSADITGTGLPAVGTPVQFATTGALPTNFTTSTIYYVVSNTSGTTIQVAVIPNGTAIVAGSAGSGVQTLTGTLGGIPVSEINGNHQITVIDADSFSFEVTTPATSTETAAGGTAIVIDFELEPGNAITVGGYGWGVGTWGRDAWGLGTSGAPIYLPQRDWWFDNFYNDLVLNVRNGEGYWWSRGTNVDPATALATKAVRLVDYVYDWAVATSPPNYTATEYSEAVPVKIMQLMVSQQDKHLIAFGAVPYGSTNPDDFDPLLIRWADQDTPEDWIPQTTNSAGDIRISRGSTIVRAMPTRQEILVWTDTHLYTMQFLGTTDVFSLQEYADNISVASPRSMTTAANITYWMGQDKFYAYTGRVETLPCTLRDHVFGNFNALQSDQVVSGTNEEWNEVWWFYPTADSDYNDAYVVYNHLERIWYYGTMDRTAWLDTPLRDYPQAANTPGGTNDGYVYSHEVTVDADGEPMESYIQSSDFDLEDGDQFMLIRRILPDVNFGGSEASDPEVKLVVRPRDFPGSAFRSDAADTQRVVEVPLGTYTDQVFMRARARQMAFKIMSENLGVNWQLGAPRLDARPDGRR